VQDWRNSAGTELETDVPFVVLHGDNGQGKTNLLEAVYVLAALRSFREARSARMVRQGTEAALVQAEVRGASGRRRLRWSWARSGGRRLQLDGRAPSDLSEWFAVLRAVLFSPELGTIVRGEPAARRRFLDRAAFTAEPGHLAVVRDYRRALQQKGALLRSGSSDSVLLDTFDARLVALGARLVARRRAIVDQLQGPFQHMYAALLHRNDPEDVSLRLLGFGAGQDAVDDRLADALARSRSEELRRRQVLVGPHRDDLAIELDGRRARNFASQGQARSVVLALKLAELSAARARGTRPLFLLDDLTGELDRGRMERLIALLSALDSQVWITTTDPAWLGPLPPDGTRTFRIDAGKAEETRPPSPRDG